MTATITRAKRKTPPNGQAVSPPAAVTDGPKIEMVRPDRLTPHPDNPRKHFDKEKLKALAGSMRTVGLLTPILVRPIGRKGELQILGGERRWRAAKLAELPAVPVQIKEGLSDAEALVLVACDNENREELLPLERARSVVAMARPANEGGGGLTLAEAAGKLGKSESWAKNLARLVKLPKWWQQKIDAGILPERLARYLLPCAELKGVMGELQALWEGRNFDGEEELPWGFKSEEEIRRSINIAVDEQTAPMDGSWCPRTWEVDGRDLHSWQIPTVKLPLFAPTDEQREKLAIVKIGDEERATNIEYWLELAREEYDKRVRAKLKREETQRSGGATKNGKHSSPAEQKADEKRKAAEAAQRLAQNMHAWLYRWARHVIATQVQPGDWQATKLVLCVLPDFGGHRWHNGDGSTAASIVQGDEPERSPVGTVLMRLANEDEVDTAVAAIARTVLDDLRNGYSVGEPCRLDDKLVATLVADYGIDLADAWMRCQKLPIGSKGHNFLVDFYAMHGKPQLEQLAAELGVHIYRAKTKASIVGKLSDRSMGQATLPMPKSLIKLVARMAGPAKPTTKKTRRAK